MTRKQILQELELLEFDEERIKQQMRWYATFWSRMRLLFAELDEGQIERFFEQLQKNADEISVHLELAQKRVEMAGFQSNPS